MGGAACQVLSALSVCRAAGHFTWVGAVFPFVTWVLTRLPLIFLPDPTLFSAVLQAVKVAADCRVRLTRTEAQRGSHACSHGRATEPLAVGCWAPRSCC